MKIHQLPLGARFEYEGQAYVKTGPLFGTGKDGQRLIPKYAVLKVADDSEASGGKRNALARGAVVEAFDHFFRSCESLVPAEKQPALRAARERFIKALG